MFFSLSFCTARRISGNMLFVMSQKDMATGMKIINGDKFFKKSSCVYHLHTNASLLIDFPSFCRHVSFEIIFQVLTKPEFKMRETGLRVSQDLAADSGSDTRASFHPCCDPTAGGKAYERQASGRAQNQVMGLNKHKSKTEIREAERFQKVVRKSTEKSSVKMPKMCLLKRRGTMKHIATF